MKLLELLDYKKAYREHRRKPALYVLQHPEQMKHLVACSVGEDVNLSTKAIWSLEFVCREDLTLLYPYLEEISEFMPKANTDGAKRTLSYLCELLTIAYYKEEDQELKEAFSETQKKYMINACFDWLIANEKVACEVRAFTALYYFGQEYDWIHPELNQILKTNLHQKSAGYQSRGKKILKAIANFSNKKDSQD